jgi:hypothetical protein
MYLLSGWSCCNYGKQMSGFHQFKVSHTLFIVKSLLQSQLNHTEKQIYTRSYFGHFTNTHRHSDETEYGGAFPETILIYRLWLTQFMTSFYRSRIAGNSHTICLTLKEPHPTPHWQQAQESEMSQSLGNMIEITWRTIVELLHTMGWA